MRLLILSLTILCAANGWACKHLSPNGDCLDGDFLLGKSSSTTKSTDTYAVINSTTPEFVINKLIELESRVKKLEEERDKEFHFDFSPSTPLFYRHPASNTTEYFKYP